MALPRRNADKLFSPLRTTGLPCILVWMMMLYIVVDLSMHLVNVNHERFHNQVKKQQKHESNNKPAAESSEDAEDSQSTDASSAVPKNPCNTIESHIDVHEDQIRHAQDPWNQLKWSLPPAECPVKSHLIERLDPLNNYRRGVALGFTTDLDDRSHLEHWFLGTKVDLNKASRRVFIDLGANTFDTSITWFATRYPVDFTEIYAFETVRSLLKVPTGWDEDSNWMPPGSYGWKKIRSRAAIVPSWFAARVKTFATAASVTDSVNSINITRFIKDELKLKPKDTVIVKIDIEGAEWPILDAWVKDPEMPKIIDELFVELHYYHPDNRWLSVKSWSRETATKMLAELRFKGFFAHYWD